MTKEYSDFLAHHGVKGQKWGVRRYQNEDGSLTSEGKQRYSKSTDSVKTSNGETLVLERKKAPAIARLLSKVVPAIRNNMENDRQYVIKRNEKRIGDLEVFRESKDSVNVVWIGIDDKERGRGYASSVMKHVIDRAKKEKMSKVTLEVPGNSPDARHIYEKLGFKNKGRVSDENDVWKGLTAMELDLRRKRK